MLNVWKKCVSFHLVPWLCYFFLIVHVYIVIIQSLIIDQYLKVHPKKEN